MEHKLSAFGATVLTFKATVGGVTVIIPAGNDNYDKIIAIMSDVNNILIENRYFTEQEEKKKAEEAEKPEIEVLESEEVDDSKEEESDPEDNK